MSQIFALVDCNNFYASCERLFRPDLAGKPVLVLSNNDGCVVARSAETKALGIKMGVPVFQVKDVIRQHNIQVFSSNYPLYADLSSRVMRTLETLAPRVEVYSIDEAFLDLTGMKSVCALEDFGRQVKSTVEQWTGISVCIGIAPTKTLAKLANHAAKKYPATGGVVDLTSKERQKKLLALTPVGDIWGVGKKLTQKLEAIGIHTALELAQSSPERIRQQFSVVLERTLYELNGVPCLEIEEVAPHKQQIISSRSFGRLITRLDDMKQAIAQYTARAAEKLRAEQQQAKVLTVFIQTNRFKQSRNSYSNSATGQLAIPSSDTRVLTTLAMQLLQSIWKDEYQYNKGGVMLADFYDQHALQTHLFDDAQQTATSNKLMAAVDSINNSGLGKVFLARQGMNNIWSMRREYLSPAYTTQWSDLPKVK